MEQHRRMVRKPENGKRKMVFCVKKGIIYFQIYFSNLFFKFILRIFLWLFYGIYCMLLVSYVTSDSPNYFIQNLVNVFNLRFFMNFCFIFSQLLNISTTTAYNTMLN